MFRPIFAVGFLLVAANLTSAAIVYEPVQYQYADPVHGRPIFYYGGSNPAVLWSGANYQARYHVGLNSVRNIGFDEVFVGPLNDDLLHHGLIGHAAVTYTDLLPPGMNAWQLGFTPDDARNEAYLKVPRYERKRDLLASGHLTPSGNIVILAQSPHRGMVQNLPARPPTTQPATRTSPSPILIIPKGLLDKHPQPSVPSAE